MIKQLIKMNVVALMIFLMNAMATQKITLPKTQPLSKIEVSKPAQNSVVSMITKAQSQFFSGVKY